MQGVVHAGPLGRKCMDCPSPRIVENALTVEKWTVAHLTTLVPACTAPKLQDACIFDGRIDGILTCKQCIYACMLCMCACLRSSLSLLALLKPVY